MKLGGVVDDRSKSPTLRSALAAIGLSVVAIGCGSIASNPSGSSTSSTSDAITVVDTVVDTARASAATSVARTKRPRRCLPSGPQLRRPSLRWSSRPTGAIRSTSSSRATARMSRCSAGPSRRPARPQSNNTRVRPSVDADSSLTRCDARRASRAVIAEVGGFILG